MNVDFTRFGPRTVHPTQMDDYYIGLPDPYAPRGPASARPRERLITGKLLAPATISGCTITMDLGAAVCSMTDRLARGPD